MRRRFIVDPGDILEVSSYDVNGNVRDLFEDARSYLGIDQTVGPNVDLVLNAHDLGDYFADRQFDSVLCLEIPEHDPTPWVTIGHLGPLLRPGGFLLVSTPTFGFPYHPYSKEYYRFGEEAYRDVIFEGFEIRYLATVRDDSAYPGICGVGTKRRRRPTVTTSSLAGDAGASSGS